MAYRSMRNDLSIYRSTDQPINRSTTYLVITAGFVEDESMRDDRRIKSCDYGWTQRVSRSLGKNQPTTQSGNHLTKSPASFTSFTLRTPHPLRLTGRTVEKHRQLAVPQRSPKKRLNAPFVHIHPCKARERRHHHHSVRYTPGAASALGLQFAWNRPERINTSETIEKNGYRNRNRISIFDFTFGVSIGCDTSCSGSV